jgi:hypothetical protein
MPCEFLCYYQRFTRQIAFMEQVWERADRILGQKESKRLQDAGLSATGRVRARGEHRSEFCWSNHEFFQAWGDLSIYQPDEEPLNCSVPIPNCLNRRVHPKKLCLFCVLYS